MKLLLLPALLLFSTTLLQAQTCHYNDLSSSLRFTVQVKRIEDKKMDRPAQVKLFIINRHSGRQVQLIEYTSEYLFDKTFTRAKASRSYTTGKRARNEAMDNDWGDVAVADFNFDGREDIAIIKDSGGNGGPMYNYYLQNSKGRFVQDRFLSEKMEFFPTWINKRKRTLTTLVHANAYQKAKTTYRLNTRTGQWSKTKRSFVNY